MTNIKTAFIVYCRAVGLYALFTIPALTIPEMYLMSLMYVLIYGWFAWFVFTLLYMLTINLVFDFVFRFLCLFSSVIAAVAFAYHMIGLLGVEQDVWHSGFIVFPFAAVIVGWISVCISRESIRSAGFVTEG
jgi:hypothetical protein